MKLRDVYFTVAWARPACRGGLHSANDGPFTEEGEDTPNMAGSDSVPLCPKMQKPYWSHEVKYMRREL